MASDLSKSPRGVKRTPEQDATEAWACSSDKTVLADLRVPGLYSTFEVAVRAICSIAEAKEILLDSVSKRLSSEGLVKVGTAWLVYFIDDDHHVILEEEAIESAFQLACLEEHFDTHAVDKTSQPHVRLCWHEHSHFELIIFSLLRCTGEAPENHVEEAFTFRHKEMSGAPDTFLSNNSVTTHLRAWDFCTGQSFRSMESVVFSFSANPRNKRDFMDMSLAKEDEQQKFEGAPEGAVLGMGSNAIVHRVQCTASVGPARGSKTVEEASDELQRSKTVAEISSGLWDAAVKRPFTFYKMVATMSKTAEAGMVRRSRMAQGLNKFKHLMYFYGLGIALASNCDDREEFRFEMVLLSRYNEDFAAYTLKKFMDDYMMVVSREAPSAEVSERVQDLQDRFSLIKIKALLVSLIHGFRDLTIMGIQAYDFNHLNNVLVSRDCTRVHLLDMDGEGKGPINFPSEYILGKSGNESHKPALDVDLKSLLPLCIFQLLLGKGRGKSFVDQKLRDIKRAASKSEDNAKSIIEEVIREDFFKETTLRDLIWIRVPGASITPGIMEEAKRSCEPHIRNVVEWLFAVVMKRPPWTHWDDDIYEVQRCVDHLPIL